MLALRPAQARPLCLPRAAKTVCTAAAMRLEARSAVVTGGNRGIGLELVRQLLAKGNTVIATARQPAKADELQALAAGAGGRLHVMQLDVTDPASVGRWATGVKALARHIDLVVNNAGVTDGWKGLEEVSPEDMLDCFVTNAIGPLLVTQQLHKEGVLGSASGGPSLVANMTSKMGSIDDNGSGSDYAYRASKAALNIVNKSLSIDLAGEDITCVLLHPGYVRTDMTGWTGNIDTATCVKGLLGVLESDQDLNGRWFDFAGKEVPW